MKKLDGNQSPGPMIRAMWSRLSSLPGGKLLFSKAIGKAAPYTGTIGLDYDPLYNPDKYISVKNASWLQLDEKNQNLTIFQFMIHNQSKFVMTDLVLAATIKDKTGKELELVEISVEGSIPSHEAVMVGTLQPEDLDDIEDRRLLTTELFKELVEEDEELNLRWSDGVEVEMHTSGFTEANIDILEVRAVPND